MSFNGSFCDENFAEDDNNINNTNDIVETGDIKVNVQDFNQDNKNQNNEIFNCLSTGIDNSCSQFNSNSVNIYNTILSKEILNYNLSNIFSVINEKVILLKSKFFQSMKIINNKKTNQLIAAEILLLKINSKLRTIFKIAVNLRKKHLYKYLYKWRNFVCFSTLSQKLLSKSNNFRQKYENECKKDLDKILDENNANCIKLDKEVKDIEKNIKNLKKKEADLKTEINILTKKEKAIKDDIKTNEALYNSLKQSNESLKQRSSNKSSINSKSDNDISIIEDSIEKIRKQIKEKEELKNNFLQKMEVLINEYKIYIDNLMYSNNINSVNGNNNEMSDGSNQQSLSHKDGSGINTCYTSKTLSKNQSNRIQGNNNNFSQGNVVGNNSNNNGVNNGNNIG